MIALTLHHPRTTKPRLVCLYLLLDANNFNPPTKIPLTSVHPDIRGCWIPPAKSLRTFVQRERRECWIRPAKNLLISNQQDKSRRSSAESGVIRDLPMEVKSKLSAIRVSFSARAGQRDRICLPQHLVYD